MPELLPFSEAVEPHLRKELFPTDLNTAEIRRLESAFLRQSVFSSKVDNSEVLQTIKDVVNEIINPVTATRPDGSPYTKGMDQATAMLKLKKVIDQTGHRAAPEDRDTLRDLSSYVRRKLIVKTNVEMAQGMGQFIQANTPGALKAFPCWEFLRFEDRKEKRDWQKRWRLAAQVAGDVETLRVLEETGRMIARIDSGIWQALGDGAGGYTDTLGNPYDPIAFGTGMGRIAIARSASVKLGLLKADTFLEPTTIEFTPIEVIPDSITDETLREILEMSDEDGDDAPLVVNRLLGVFEKLENRNDNHDSLGRFARGKNQTLGIGDNIKRGTKALRRALNQETDVAKAMQVRGLGTVDFVWGRPGHTAPNDKGQTHTDGYGVSHINAKHGRDAVLKLPQVLAHGEIHPHPEDKNKRLVFHKKWVASVFKPNKDTAWVVTSLDDSKGKYSTGLKKKSRNKSGSDRRQVAE